MDPGLLVTVYEVTVPEGGVNAMEADVDEATVAETAVGADGGDTGVILDDAVDADDVPAELVAVTVNV